MPRLASLSSRSLTGIGLVAPGLPPVTDPVITVDQWEIGVVPGGSYIVQITAGSAYAALSALPAGTQLNLIDDGDNGGDITVVCPNAPSTISALTRITFAGVTGYTGINRVGLRLEVLD